MLILVFTTPMQEGHFDGDWLWELKLTKSISAPSVNTALTVPLPKKASEFYYFYFSDDIGDLNVVVIIQNK